MSEKFIVITHTGHYLRFREAPTAELNEAFVWSSRNAARLQLRHPEDRIARVHQKIGPNSGAGTIFVQSILSYEQAREAFVMTTADGKFFGQFGLETDLERAVTFVEPFGMEMFDYEPREPGLLRSVLDLDHVLLEVPVNGYRVQTFTDGFLILSKLAFVKAPDWQNHK